MRSVSASPGGSSTRTPRQPKWSAWSPTCFGRSSRTHNPTRPGLSFRSVRTRGRPSDVARAAGVAFELPEDPLQRLDLRRRLLTDGRTLVPSSFRPFLADARALDEARPRVGA